MSKPKHSEAPFSVDEGGLIIDATGCALAAVYGAEDFPCLSEEDHDAVNLECCANARLFAAAPDLLAACKEARDELALLWDDHLIDPEPKSTGNAYEMIELLDAAIAKAEGNTDE